MMYQQFGGNTKAILSRDRFAKWRESGIGRRWLPADANPATHLNLMMVWTTINIRIGVVLVEPTMMT